MNDQGGIIREMRVAVSLVFDSTKVSSTKVYPLPFGGPWGSGPESAEGSAVWIWIWLPSLATVGLWEVSGPRWAPVFPPG